MRLTRVGLGAAAALWVGYAWGAHLMTLAATWRGPARGRRIALTFDDGPDPLWTPRIAETLAARDVSSTFFLVGRRADAHRNALRAIVDAGHEVASHGWSHRNLWFCGPRRTEDEVVRAQDRLAELTGRAPRFFRPPWGMVNAALFGALGLPTPRPPTSSTAPTREPSSTSTTPTESRALPSVSRPRCPR
jgi:peptidoglycan/xylan/chitin deacetylase (PgdA/CDA1 family)